MIPVRFGGRAARLTIAALPDCPRYYDAKYNQSVPAALSPYIAHDTQASLTLRCRPPQWHNRINLLVWTTFREQAL